MSSASFSAAPTALPTVLCMAMSHDGATLAVGTQDSFIVYHIGGRKAGGVEFKGVAPASAAAAGANSSAGAATAGHPAASGHFQEVARRRVPGGVAHIAVVEQFNVLLFSGASEQTRNVVTLWDDARVEEDESAIVAQLALQSTVRALRLSARCILVAEDTCTHVFDSGLNLLESYPTPRALSTAPGSATAGPSDNNSNTIALATKDAIVDRHGGVRYAVLRMVMLGPSTGSVRCVEYVHSALSAATSMDSLASGHAAPGRADAAVGKLQSKMANPHERGVHALAICLDGSKAVSVSERGTALKVIDVAEGAVLRQLTRGTTVRSVNSIAINANSTLAAAISDSGTVHIFALHDQQSLPTGGSSGKSLHPAGLASAGLSAIKGAFSLSMGLMPDAIAKNKFVAPMASYTAADNALAVLRLGADDADSAAEDSHLKASAPSLDDSARLLYDADGFGVAAQSQPTTLQGDFACLAWRPGLRRDTEATLVVAQGSTTPAALGVKSRCVRIAVDVVSKTCTKNATYLFPKEEL